MEREDFMKGRENDEFPNDEDDGGWQDEPVGRFSNRINRIFQDLQNVEICGFEGFDAFCEFWKSC